MSGRCQSDRMTIRTAKYRLFRHDVLTGAEKAWEMRPGFFGLSGGWRIMFCLDGVEFSFVFFLLSIQEIYVLSVSSEFSLCRVVLGRKTPVPTAFTGEKGRSSRGGGSVTGRSEVFSQERPVVLPRIPGRFMRNVPVLYLSRRGFWRGCPFTSVRKRLPEERKFRIGRSVKQAF